MELIKILLIEDDEDDFIIVKDSLSNVENIQYELQWVDSFQNAMEKAFTDEYDICLLDFRLGMRDGLSVLKKLKEDNFNAPIIMLTGQGSRDVDLDAMKMGAYDYIEKEHLNPKLLERAIRYGIDRWTNMRQLKESEQKLRQLSAKILQAQEDERKHIAKELHDSIGSNLTAIKFMLETNNNNNNQGDNHAPMGMDFPIEKILTAVKETMEETQRITHNLRPQTLDKLGLIPSLNSLVRHFSEINNTMHVDTLFEVEEKNIPEPLKISIFRVTQESLNNIAKHSEANHAEVRFTYSDSIFELVIVDNGKGFDSQAIAAPNAKTSMGLSGMQERVELTDGCFEVVSHKNNGTLIRAFWNQS